MQNTTYFRKSPDKKTVDKNRRFGDKQKLPSDGLFIFDTNKNKKGQLKIKNPYAKN